MSDILQRLESRISALDHDIEKDWVEDLGDAFDEIERLRAELAAARDLLKEALEWLDEYTPAELVTRIIDALKGDASE